MDKIQRLNRDGDCVRYSDHLAALEAQAEEHRVLIEQQGREMEGRHESELKFRDQIHGERMDAKAEEHRKALEKEAWTWQEARERLLAQHAQELKKKFRAGWEAGEAAAVTDGLSLRGEGEPALIQYVDTHLIGEPCMIHAGFSFPMGRIVKHAHDCGVKIWVTHSFRPLNAKLVGAIVEQAERSNHHAGSAVDMNPMYDGVWYTSEMMKDLDGLPAPVYRFLRDVTLDPDLRWGGAFGINKDRVHFDDDLVRRDPDAWASRVKELNDV